MSEIYPIVKLDLPSPKRQRFPFDEMQPGEGFMMKPDDNLNSLRVAASRYSKDGKKFAVRKLADGQYRCSREA